jgi:hypothetical protein
MTTKLEQAAFNEIMQKAIRTREIHPNADVEAIAILACSEYQGKPEYDELIFQVVYNLVNLDK